MLADGSIRVLLQVIYTDINSRYVLRINFVYDRFVLCVLEYHRSHVSVATLLVALLRPQHVPHYVVLALAPAPAELMAQGIRGLVYPHDKSP